MTTDAGRWRVTHTVARNPTLARTLRGYLAFALARLGDRSIVPDLQENLTAEVSPELLRWSAVGLGLLGDPSLSERLIALYRRKGEMLSRASAVYTLGLVGDRRVIDFLVSVATNSREVDEVRAFAVYSLGLLCDIGAEPLPSRYARDHNYTLAVPFLPELYHLF